MGVRLKALREKRGLTQLALASALKLSPSYLNQIENDQRPLTVAVLLRLQSAFGIDLQLFSEDEQARTLTDLREVFADVPTAGAVPLAEAQTIAQQMPSVTQVLFLLHKRARSAEERLSAIAASADGDRYAGDLMAPLQPYEEVRDFFYARHDHMAELDLRAEALYERLHVDMERTETSDDASALALRLERYLNQKHDITVRYTTAVDMQRLAIRRYDGASRMLTLSRGVEPGQRAFQIGIQIAFLEMSALIDSYTQADAFTTAEARSLARIGFANHFAGALVLPNRRLQTCAEELRYDIDLLSERFGVSFETLGHRLSTMHRAGGQGIPFFFVRVDRAGNISKRQSSADFHFSRTGGTCPLWNVYEAFAHPGKTITQLARMPDGRTYLWVARSVEHRRGGHGAPTRSFAVALGCDVKHADRLVYAKGLALADPEAATPIGAGCKVCDRDDCAQRAFPALGRALRIDENLRQFAPYASGSR